MRCGASEQGIPRDTRPRQSAAALDPSRGLRHTRPDPWSRRTQVSFWSKVFGWWDRQTLNTRYHTWRYGQRVGADSLGNTYYEATNGRRWVIYSGETEASTVPPEWHGWLHHTYKQPPTVAPMPERPWQLPPQPNLTGTPGAYHPDGSLMNAVPLKRSDYDAWRPE